MSGTLLLSTYADKAKLLLAIGLAMSYCGIGTGIAIGPSEEG